MPDRLDRYREMRDFSATPEPTGDDQAESAPAGSPRFVVQEHHATALHWDLRLEHEGTLASWAVPKGIPAHPAQNNLAVQTEDHPLMYLEFHGEIPDGSYGAGRMTVWDSGVYEAHKFDEREVMVTLHGERVRGRYVLFCTGGKQWMIHRMDPPQDVGREVMPEPVRPMRATPGARPDDDESYAFCVDVGGLHVVAAIQGGRVTAIAEDGTDVGPQFPELAPFGRGIGSLEVMLDLRLVVLGPDGVPAPDALARRVAAGKASLTRRLAESHPALILIDDLLWLEGRSLVELGTGDRRRLLEQLDLSGPTWRVNPFSAGGGAALLDAAAAQGLPGVLARRLDAPYVAGEAKGAWISIRA